MACCCNEDVTDGFLQMAYDISSKTITQFRETVQGLLLNPLKLEISPQANGVPRTSNKAVNKAKKQFEEPSVNCILQAKCIH